MSRGHRTQGDIVAEKYGDRPDVKVASFKEDKLPALGTGFKSEEEFGRFALNTLRMRRTLAWQFTLCDPSASIRWDTLLSNTRAARLDLKEKADKVAEVLFGQDSCVGVRVSVDSGIEVGFAAETPPEDPTLLVAYKII
jgi:hypothetical protein